MCSNNDWEFPQINVRHQITDLGSTGNTKQVNIYKKSTPKLILKLQKIKDKVL